MNLAADGFYNYNSMSDAEMRKFWKDVEKDVLNMDKDTGLVHKKASKARDTQEGGNHYKDKAMQPWDIIDAWELDFYAGNVVKYILRYRFKDGVNDLKKARHYIDKLIEDYEDAT